MSGLRIHHPVERNVILLIPIPAKTPEFGGTPKDIRIHLDENGDSIISEGVWGELQRAALSGLWTNDFVILNEVPDPPTIVAGLGDTKVNLKRAMKGTRNGIHDANLQAIAQKFAPKGVKVRITTNKENGK